MRWLLPLLIIVFIGLQYRLWIGEGSWANIVSIERTLVEQKITTHTLEQRNAELAREVYSLKNGYEAIEERARTELGMIKEDETFYLLISDKNTSRKP
ncbi:cell division protein FtsB [Dasania marina]|uniref:cell division protein FtsB n=1 Tax=Dasania marina TaxID=471499 RepID=UPI0003774A01|nr:cell division protein FtsB [Dasania marina]|tara:strand:- start:45036 stop:45329 length:294 start_codon:yes stop_codon:yes gene_type:complete